MTIPLRSSCWIIYKTRKYYIYVVSSMFVLLFSGFDTFHAQGKVRMVCRWFEVMLDLIQENACFKGESTMAGTVLDVPVSSLLELI